MKRVRGRKKNSLCSDEERYAVALLEAQRIIADMTGKAFNERQAAALAAAYLGPFSISQPAYIRHYPHSLVGSKNRRSPGRRALAHGFNEVEVVAPDRPTLTGVFLTRFADRLRKKRSLHSEKLTQDGKWLASIAAAWLCALRPELAAHQFQRDPRAFCLAIAERVGERRFASDLLLKLLIVSQAKAAQP